MILQSGVPQGSVLSPALFNFFVSVCPALADELQSYVDDFYVTASDSCLETLGRKLQALIYPIIKWASSKKLLIAPAKSQVTLFTPWNREFNSRHEIQIDGIDIPLWFTPRWLGSYLDSMFCMNCQSNHNHSKSSQLVNLVKAVSGTTWGHDKETLLLTYKALV
jgi:hypothetical protein